MNGNLPWEFSPSFFGGKKWVVHLLVYLFVSEDFGHMLTISSRILVRANGWTGSIASL